VRQRVLCGITGGGPRHETRQEMLRRGAELGLGLGDESLIVDVAPAYILQAGLPYSRSDLAIVLDAEVTDVPERYREPERAQKLVSVVADAVRRGGVVIAPAKEWEVQDYARDGDCRVAIFATNDDVTANDKRVARAVALVEGGRIAIERNGATTDAGPLRADAPAAAQVAGALAVYILGER
jgi:hypothetical protein